MISTQCNTVLELLKSAGDAGINSYDLTYKYGIKQGPTRISELKEQGHEILSQTQANRSVQYYLLATLHTPQATTRAKSKPKKEYFTWKIEDMDYDKATNTWRYK